MDSVRMRERTGLARKLKRMRVVVATASARFGSLFAGAMLGTGVLLPALQPDMNSTPPVWLAAAALVGMGLWMHLKRARVGGQRLPPRS